MLNIKIDLMKLAHWLRTALWAVDGGISDELYASIQASLVSFLEARGYEIPTDWV